MKRILALIIVAIFIFLAMPKVSANAQLKGETARITYEYVNVRANHSTHSRILNVLDYGDTVHLTGERCEYWLDEIHAVWYEVVFPTSEGTDTGWIVAEAIQF